VVILAESEKFSTDSRYKVSTELDTTNNKWEITVIYGNHSNWYPWALVACFLLSLFMSLLVYSILSQKQLHANAIAEKTNQIAENAKKSAKVERELNDFIAHEVRNPLSAALSACSFVSASVNEKEPLIDEESRKSVREDVQIIQNSLQFVNDLLRSMLDLHRAKSQQMMLDYIPTDIRHDILQPVAAMLYRRDENFDVHVHCHEPIVVSVDRLRLKQIVLNLARNSAKFVEHGFVRLTANKTPNGICIHVEDSGPGIPEEKRHQLFAKFQKSLDELSQGTGIGLSLCQKLIELMNGSIELDNDYDSGIPGCPGAKFDIFVSCQPVAMDVVSDGTVDISSEFHSHSGGDPEISRVGEDNPVDGATTTPKDEEEQEAKLPKELRVLFVDDDLILRKLFIRTLKRTQPDWQIKEASNGETAVAMVQQEEFDLIFLDQYMTSVEKQLLGTETTRLMRSQGITSTICGLSANDMESAFAAAGANAFMMKPFPCKPKIMHAELFRILKSSNAEGSVVAA